MKAKQKKELQSTQVAIGNNVWVAPRTRTGELDEVFTERLRFRGFGADDAPRVLQLAGHKEMSETTLNIPFPYTLPQIETWLASLREEPMLSKEIHFAVETDGDLVGTVRLILSPEHDKAKMGYWIGKEYWGNGYATEAAAAALAYGFNRLQLNRVCANCFDNNPASVKILERIGMTLEGTLRQHVKKWDEYRDLLIYGMLKEGFQH